MKSFTDIEQSKKLAEFLPLGSADMYWLNRHIDLTENKYELFVVDKSNKHIDFFNSYTVAVNEGEIIPCWSLAALLELIPPYLGKFEDGIDFGFSKSINGKWYSAHYIQFNDNGLSTFNKTVTGDTPIDAVFEMICWLNENKKI